jgi:hypothetical protein
MWKKVEDTILMLAVSVLVIIATLELTDFHKWWNTPSTAEAIYTEEMLGSVKNGDLVLCATDIIYNESKTSMVIEMAMIVDVNRPRSEELDGRTVGKKNLKLDVKKYTDFERCRWVAVLTDEEDKKEAINNIMISGTPVVVTFPNQPPLSPSSSKTPHYLFF